MLFIEFLRSYDLLNDQDLSDHFTDVPSTGVVLVLDVSTFDDQVLVNLPSNWIWSVRTGRHFAQRLNAFLRVFEIKHGITDGIETFTEVIRVAGPERKSSTLRTASVKNDFNQRLLLILVP